MTTQSKREAANKVIRKMPLNKWQLLEELAKKGQYNRFCLTPREMAQYLREHSNLERKALLVQYQSGRWSWSSKWRKTGPVNVTVTPNNKETQKQ